MSSSQNAGPCTPITSSQLDVVGVLALLGEGSVLEKLQVRTLSKWTFLPRVMLAPQGLLRTIRPTWLETSPGHVVGIFSRSQRDSVYYIGNVIW